jgi:multiple sugar transport system permease protein
MADRAGGLRADAQDAPAAVTPLAPGQGNRRHYRLPDAALGVLLVLPSVLLFVALIAYPIVQAFLLSVRDVSTLTLAGGYTGLKNYHDVLARPEFWTSFGNTVVWSVASLFCQMLLGIAVALLLNLHFAGRSVARGVIMLPYLLSTVVTVLIWQWLLNDLYGIVDSTLMRWNFTDSPVPWLTRMPNAMITLVLIGAWKLFPFVVITVLARLQSIPEQLYEAARIDGAGAFARFWDITLPQIRSVLFLILLLRGIWDFKEFDLIFLLTGGGPQIGTQTLPLLIYKEAFGLLHLGRGAAVAIVMFMIMMAMFAVYLWQYQREAREAVR